MGCHEGVEGAGDQQRAFDWPWGFLCEEHLQVAPHTIRTGQQDDQSLGPAAAELVCEMVPPARY
jgi:hypothetical protein